VKQELASAAGKVAAGIPTAYAISWFTGFPWGPVSAFLACMWTLGLMWKHWIWQPVVKPWLARRG